MNEERYESLGQDNAPERVFCWVTRWKDDGYIEVSGVDAGCEADGIEYIRADIVATKNDWLNAQLDAAQTSLTYWRDLCAVTEQALNKTGESLLAKVEKITRLENIIADMSAREVDAALARDETLKELLELVPECTCDGAYLSRGLIAPDCQYHSSGMEEVEEIVRGWLAGREVNTLALNDGEVLWTCDGCGAHGVVPAEWKWVPGWTFDVVTHDGKWYCMGCQERMGWLAAEEKGDG